MSYATQGTVKSAPNNGRVGPAYRRAKDAVRARARAGECCWFWGRDPQCPYPGFNWYLPPNHRDAFTAHHLDRVMDGGDPVPDPALMVPAHRGCNARDGLKAQNARRAARLTVIARRHRRSSERTSRDW